ncbi:MAG: DUF1189 domain-containing protein [Candidatus Moraniibacteriota bacterium]|nr:MAG: DUF1189 domain-containing protein [Candidatus Moranbacteria bacterium]
MFESIKSIFYRPDFFRRQEFTGGQTLGFYSLSVLFLVVGLSLVIIPALWGVNRFFESARWEKEQGIITSLYPDDLILTLHNGLTTNQEDPVVIPFPEEWRNRQCNHKKQCKDTLPTNLLVFDAATELSRKSIAAHDTLILASETEIGMNNLHRGETRIFGLAEIQFDKKITITKNDFTYWVHRGADIMQTAVLFLMAVLPLCLFFAIWIGYIVYSLFGALVVWLAAHLRQHRLTYGQAYLSTLYLLPASFALTVVMSAMSFRIPLLFTLVLFLMALLNFEKKGNGQPEPLPKPVEIIDTPQRPA